MMLRDRLLLFALMSGSATTALTLVVLIPVLPLLAAHFGDGGPALSQAVMTAPALGLIAGGFLSAAAIRLVGTWRLLIMGLALYGLTGSAGLWSDGATLMLGARFLLGIAASFIGIASTALIAALYPPEPRARLIGIKGALGSIGGIAGILIGGELGMLGGWRLPFAIYLIGWLLLAMALAGRRPVVVPPATAARAAGQGLMALWPFYVAIVGFGIVLMMTNTQLSFLLGEIGISAPSRVARVAVLAPVGAAIGGFSYGAVRRRLSSRSCFALVFGLWTVGLATLGFSQGVAIASLGCVIAGLAAGLFLPHMITTLTSVAAPEVRDRAIAMFYSAIFLGDFLNPLVIEPISEVLGRHGAFRAVATVTAVSMLAVLIRRRPAQAKA
ncbi:MFS transporter [Sphingomonas sanxanigenens]|uniref:Major facilitator superfamily (MFS) profile domain-containing protein n=1 Tax=Sphingomonas sanxanigenens DSM 19645 = NX02 TaxID=1123269 RepID=W0AAY7_9SPHN|nr:MFS transporter [Sphingomonas sanxanigenens]AHE55084.1 hypothetical protein NX02_17030 [Sphingomonas sanxanigenens DSM 19645 = NX02]